MQKDETSYDALVIKKKKVRLMKSFHFDTEQQSTVLTESPWDFIDFKLKNDKKRQALVFWSQARDFYNASKDLSLYSKPLTNYYCVLNATKALLASKSLTLGKSHGVTDPDKNLKDITKKGFSFNNERIKFLPNGNLAELLKYFDPSYTGGTTYKIKDLLGNLAFIHRSYNFTFNKVTENFPPAYDPRFVIFQNQQVAFRFGLKQQVRLSTPSHFNVTTFSGKVDQEIVLFPKQPINVTNGKINSQSMPAFEEFHSLVRRHFQFIHSGQRLWYFDNSQKFLYPSLAIIFALNHRFSELSRYSPFLLEKYLESKHGWLISEFLNSCLDNFIDEISCEIAGVEIMLPRIRS